LTHAGPVFAARLGLANAISASQLLNFWTPRLFVIILCFHIHSGFVPSKINLGGHLSALSYPIQAAADPRCAGSAMSQRDRAREGGQSARTAPPAHRRRLKATSAPARPIQSCSPPGACSPGRLTGRESGLFSAHPCLPAGVLLGGLSVMTKIGYHKPRGVSREKLECEGTASA